MTNIQIIQGDITRLDVDVIVNAANKSLLGGGGVDGAIHRAAGPDLLKVCKTLNGCATGEAKLTSGFRLPARFILHTVGPVWSEHSPENADALLARCYDNCLTYCLKKRLQSIAFPCISTGVYGFPKDRAAAIALKTIRHFLHKNTMDLSVIFCCFDGESKALYDTLLER